ncbi:hypothetical protein Tco_0039004, partial [Tanacetum coccineum]
AGVASPTSGASLAGQLRAAYKSAIKGLVAVAKVPARVLDQPEHPH